MLIRNLLKTKIIFSSIYLIIRKYQFRTKIIKLIINKYDVKLIRKYKRNVRKKERIIRKRIQKFIHKQ